MAGVAQMESFKEFQGRDLDAAIDEACTYFNTEREKLEVEIVQDAKSGIFGIVGARKAKVRARRVQLRQAVESILGRNSGRTAASQAEARAETAGQGKGERTRKPRSQHRPAPVAEEAAPAPNGPDSPDSPESPRASHTHERLDYPAESSPVPVPAPTPAPAVAAAAEPGVCPDSTLAGEGASHAPHCPAGNMPRTRVRQGERQEVREAANRMETADAVGDVSENLGEELDVAAEGLPQTPLEDLDLERLKALTEDVVRQLVRPIAGEDISLEVSVGNGRVQVQLDCDEDSGLLIGREGQTLAALRYLASRLVSRAMGAAVRIQLDAGEYRRRQDEKLREMALALAGRVRQTGRSYSTRPLSSYHRRIVHVCLQDMPDVQTRSTGDGPLKRVVISRRRAERA